MLFLGLLLLAATAAFTALAIADNLSGGPEYTVSVLDQQIATMNTLAIFSSGLALALLFCLGLALARSGAAHRRRRHRKPRPRTHAPRGTTAIHG
ncbi:hypothetical protein AB0I77_21620 [Streptomyces sp. NPDC050619]|uniref:hypothetical protein n=1 Tax=Streptomyces sp. NPDC050619 TaxID=3157214 RepID=UPI00343ED253